MARLRHSFGPQKPPQAVEEQLVPGLRYDRSSNAVYGNVDGLAGIGVDVRAEWPALFVGKPELTHSMAAYMGKNPNLLRQYQQEGVTWITNCLCAYGGAILADDMGLGKTRTAIYAASQLYDGKTILCITPASVIYQWAEESQIFGIKNYVLGPRSQSKHNLAWNKCAAGSPGLYVTSYQLAEQAFATGPFLPTVVILDEPHMVLRGRSGSIGWALKEYMQQIPYRLACTGTPMFNKPKDMWFLLFLLFGMRFGKAKEFDARYCDGRQGQYGWEAKGATNTQELKTRLSYYMLRRTLEDVALELPALTTSFRWTEGTAQARAAMMKAGGISAQATDEALHACLAAKIPLVVDTALELQGPLVVFTYHRADAETIASKIEEHGKPCVSIHGGLSVETRHKLISHCAASGTSIAATIDSCGTGVNMQGVACQGIFHTIERSPKKTHQAMKRLHRSGQTKPVHWIFTAMRDCMDEIVVDEVVKRLTYWNQIMGSDDMQDNVGEALAVSEDSEDAVLAAIYKAMQT